MDAKLSKDLRCLALRIRIATVETLKARGFGHIGGSMSIADTLAVLYGAVMKYDPKNPTWEERDRFVCSKGHAGPAVYAALAVEGFFPYAELETLNQPGTNLPSHCDRLKTKGIDMTTGSLGQGASVAVGMALGCKLKNNGGRVFAMIGDGESNEGQVWEAAELAVARNLDNLYWFIDENKRQLDGTTDAVLPGPGLDGKLAAFGFDTVRIPGNDVDAIYEAIQRAAEVKGKPHAIVLDSLKGCGIPEVEQSTGNHSMAVAKEKWQEWQDYLEARLAEMEGEN